MRRLAVLAALGGLGCGSRPAATAPQSMNQVVEQFLGAVKAKDVQRIGELWGDQRGSAAEHMKPEVLRKRTTVLQIYLANNGFRIVEGPLPIIGHDDRRTFRVELQREHCNVVTPIDVVRTGRGGWLIYDVHLESLPNPAVGCGAPGSGTGP